MRTRSGQAVLTLVAFALAAAFAPARAAEYTFAVEPSYRPERTAEIYKPLVDYLAKSTGE